MSVPGTISWYQSQFQELYPGTRVSSRDYILVPGSVPGTISWYQGQFQELYPGTFIGFEQKPALITEYYTKTKSRGAAAPFVINISTGCKHVVSYKLLPLYLLGNIPPCTMGKWLGGFTGPSGRLEKTEISGATAGNRTTVCW